MMFRRAFGLAAVVIAMSGGQVFAQTVDENRDADALAADMRLLAANPLDIEALITAGELTLKMGDNTAAATFFGRAEKLDPLNPRLKAGYGSLMVRAERPGEALRRFQEAEARGFDPRKYAADRGLAYDLIGEQERAQRDYRLVLQAGPNDEVTRRYALSLGISGRKKEALDVLDPLLRRNDRAAWRDRAFVLAMSGDQEGAQKIANSMMSPGLGAGLAPFFERLPSLSPADRAFAVNFGELRASPTRIADARLAPALPQLGPDPTAPKVLAVATPPKPRVVPADDGKKHKKRRNDEGLAPAVPAPTPAPAPVEVAMNPPAYVPPRVEVASPASPSSVRTIAETSRPTPAPVPVSPPTAAEAVTKVAPAPTPGFASTLPANGVVDRPSASEAGVPQTATSRVGEDAVLAKIIAGISVPGAELGVTPIPTRAASQPPVATPAPPEPKPQGKAPEPKTPTATGETSDVKGHNGKPFGTAKASEEAALDQGACLPLAKGKAGARGRATTRGRSVARCETADAKGAHQSKDDADTFDQNDCTPLAKGKAGTRGRAATRGKPLARCETADAKGAHQSKNDAETFDQNDCAPPTKGRAGTRGRATTRGKPVARCETADTKGARQSKDDADAFDQNDCVPLARGKAGTRGRAATRGKPVVRCETADTKGAHQSKNDADAFDQSDCAPPAKGKAGTRGKVATRGRPVVRCETADTKGARESKDDAVELDRNGCPVLPAKGKAGARGKPAAVAATRGRAAAKGKAAARCETADAKGSKADTATKGEPARIWVQVAGGANEDTLEKAWNAVKVKAPDLFHGRQGWSTPLRATNRVLTGPFKTEDEAQEFVNKLGKAGLSGFVFNSTKGQKVDRLGGGK